MNDNADQFILDAIQRVREARMRRIASKRNKNAENAKPEPNAYGLKGPGSVKMPYKD